MLGISPYHTGTPYQNSIGNADPTAASTFAASVGTTTVGSAASEAASTGGADPEVVRALRAAGKNEELAKGISSKRAAIRAGLIECETCANRKYQDGSDEQVSFKTAQHISPAAAGARVRGHEQEHVSNAYSKAKQDGGKVLQASVAIHTSICPECGRTYVSGGTTTTKIAYPNEENPYQKNRKEADAGLLSGMNLNVGV